MRAVIETVFDIFYLVTVLTVGIRMIRDSKTGTQFRLFGLMAVVLGAGDAFHLVPRALALCTTGLENYAVPLGLGKWIKVRLPIMTARSRSCKEPARISDEEAVPPLTRTAKGISRSNGSRNVL